MRSISVTKKEQSIINELKKLAKKWPKNLDLLFSGDSLIILKRSPKFELPVEIDFILDIGSDRGGRDPIEGLEYEICQFIRIIYL